MNLHKSIAQFGHFLPEELFTCRSGAGIYIRVRFLGPKSVPEVLSYQETSERSLQSWTEPTGQPQASRLQHCFVEFIQTANKYCCHQDQRHGSEWEILFLMFLTFKQKLCCQHASNTCGHSFVYEPGHHHRLTCVVASTQPLSFIFPVSTCWRCGKATVFITFVSWIGTSQLPYLHYLFGVSDVCQGRQIMQGIQERDKSEDDLYFST